MKKLYFTCLVCALIVLNFSCKKSVEDKIGVIWSDNVELAWYCEIFNACQDDWRLVVEYKTNIVDEFLKSETSPDIILSSFINVSATRGHFMKINHLLAKLNSHRFYNELLNLGQIDESQYLLPVSFNLPCIIFSIKNTHLLHNSFTVSFDDLKKLSPKFNTKHRGLYTKMGFAPRWEDEVLYLAMQGMDVNFEEIKPIQNDSKSSQKEENKVKEYVFNWNDEMLQVAINYLKNWTAEVNGSASEEEDFKFKYLYNVPYLLIKNNFCTFYYMPTNRLFSIPQEKMDNLDFRYLEINGKIPCNDDVLYMAITKDCKNVKAAEAFVQWFYSSETQEELLSKKMRMSILSKKFGIAGGFSAVKQVTDEIFPKYYPLLLSHLLPNDSLKVPAILPNNWNMLKNKVLMPYIKEVTQVDNSTHKVKSLESRINEWVEKRIIQD